MSIGATRIRALADKFNQAPLQGTLEKPLSDPKEKQIQPEKAELQFVNSPFAEPKKEEETCST